MGGNGDGSSNEYIMAADVGDQKGIRDCRGAR